MPTTRPRKAKYRLERMRVQEVSGVDKPANLQPFIVVKAMDGDADKAAPPAADPAAPVADPAPDSPPPAAQAPMQLGQLGPIPSAVKQSVIDCAAGVIEKIQAIAMAVGEAPVDEGAAIPPELGAMVYDCAEDLEDLASALGTPVDMAKPPVPPTPPAAHPPAAAPAAAAPPAAHPAPPPQPAAKEDAMSKGIASLKESVDRLTLQVQGATTKGLLKSIPAGNGRPPEEKPAAKAAEVWPEDFAEHVRKKRTERRS